MPSSAQSLPLPPAALDPALSSPLSPSVPSVALTLRHRENVRSQDPAKQAAVQPEDRLRLVDIKSEGGKQA